EQERAAVVERHLAPIPFAEEAGRVIDPGPDRDVRLLALEHRLGVGQRRAPLPTLHESRIAAVGERAGAEIGADVERVLVAPGGLALRLGKRKAVGDELLALE